MKLEVVVIPVAEADRSEEFYFEWEEARAEYASIVLKALAR
jgi:hypothetical protein